MFNNYGPGDEQTWGPIWSDRDPRYNCEEFSCRDCDGSGIIMWVDGPMDEPYPVDCPTCGGTGKVMVDNIGACR